MSSTITYQASNIYPPYYELALDDQPLGWVDYRQLTIASLGPGCNQLPVDTRTLSDFPGLCTITANGEVQTFTNRLLTEPYQTITPTQSSVPLLKLEQVYLASSGDVGANFFVDASLVSTHGDCDHIPSTGITTANGWLWSQPDGEKGEALVPLTPGYRVFIQEGPVEGAGPPSLSEDGAWYFVLVSPPEDGLTGWLWSSYFFIE